MNTGDLIRVEGERELQMKMQRVMTAHISAARQSLAEAGMRIVNDAKDNLRQNKSVATGQLRASGRAQAVDGDPDAVDVGFFSDNTQGGYAAYVEYGRRSGKMPPVDYLIQWVRKKLRLPEKEARARGWAMARSIARKGTQPHPFFTPAVEKNKKAVMDAIQEAIRKDIDGK